MKSDRVLVVGGSGFLGSHIADILSELGYHVTIFDINPSPFLRPDQNQIIGNLLDIEILSQIVGNYQYIIHLAGIADLDEASEKPEETVKINILGTVNLLRASCNIPLKRFIYASTVYVYSEKGGFYRCSKQAAENYIEEFGKKTGIPYLIARYGTLYGPRASMKNSIHRYIYSALVEKKILFKGSGEELREFIHVRDAARITSSLLTNYLTHTHITITGHQAMKWSIIINMISEMINNTIEIQYDSEYDSAHYYYTPYAFTPKIGEKLTSNLYCDMGQGLLEVFDEIFSKIHNH